MIRLAVVDEIQRLLDQGELSQRKIALRLGVSRGTVNAIALGKRPDYRARQPSREGEFPSPCGPAARCPSCGAMVYMPCLACRVRAMKAERRRPRDERAADRRQRAAVE
jgi:hypothetical protein